MATTKFYHKNEEGTLVPFDSQHPAWATLPGWPTKINGEPSRSHPGNAYLLECEDLYPRTTEICGALDLGKCRGLMAWAAELAIGATMETVYFFEWHKEATKLYNIRSVEARDGGAVIHDVIEQMMSGMYGEDDEWFQNQPEAAQRAYHNVEHFLEENRKRIRIADYKTVERYKSGNYRKPYPSECMQLASYRSMDWMQDLGEYHFEHTASAQLGNMRWAGTIDFIGAKDAAEYCNIYIDRDTGEIVHVQWWSDEQLSLGWEMFKLAHQAFCLEARFTV